MNPRFTAIMWWASILMAAAIALHNPLYIYIVAGLSTALVLVGLLV